MLREIRIQSVYFKEILKGNLTFLVRCDNKNYKVGDVIRLKESEINKFTGKSTLRRVSFVSKRNEFALEPSFTVLSLGLCLDAIAT